MYLLRIADDLEGDAQRALELERSNGATRPCKESASQTVSDVCPPSKYRLCTGECNNVSHRRWGARGDVFLRLLKPNYGNGKHTPRTAHSRHVLPDAEFVIEQLERHFDAEIRHPHITAMLPAWGQLLANDLYEVSQLPLDTRCCRNTTSRTAEELEQCYIRSGQLCKEYRRSAPGHDYETCSPRSKCAWLDLLNKVLTRKR